MKGLTPEMEARYKAYLEKEKREAKPEPVVKTKTFREEMDTIEAEKRVWLAKGKSLEAFGRKNRTRIENLYTKYLK